MNTRSITFPVAPVPKPRQTKADVWKERPRVVRYRIFADRMRAIAAKHRFTFPDAGAALAFYLEMPASWSKKKKVAMHGQPHQQTPDVDNLAKAVMDALCAQDCTVWRLESLTKFWSDTPQVVITVPTP